MVIRPGDVTVAIPCYNAADTLQEVLDAVANQTAPPNSVLCVDGGSTDGTDAIVRNHDAAELIRQEGPNRGIAAAQNLALERCTGKGLLQLDADVVLMENWLHVACETLSMNNDRAAVGGLMIEQVQSKADEWRVIHVSELPYVTLSGSPSNLDQLPESQLQGNLAGWDTPRTNVVLRGGIILFDTEALRAVGGWDDRYTKAYDDVSICHQLLDAGYETYFIPEAKGLHIRTDTPKSVLRTLWNYSYSGRYEPGSYRQLPSRFGNHVVQSLSAIALDIRAWRFDLAVISFLLPIIHLTMDLESLR